VGATSCDLQDKIDASRKYHSKNGINPEKYSDSFHQPRARIARAILRNVDQDRAKGDNTGGNK
jgi:hypothetical protein